MKETTISKTFGHLTDPRMERTKRHPLVNILTISLCAIISGCDDFCTMEEYGKAKGDYVLALKGSQGECFDDVQCFLNAELAKEFEQTPHSYFESVDGGNGRIEQRQVWGSTDVAWLHVRHSRWSSIQSIVRVNSIREQGGKTSQEARYFISSHKGRSAEFMAHAIRSHWHVENKLHWQLDINFSEDSLRLRSGHAAQNIALINKLALNLLKNEKTTKVGVKSKRLKAGWDNDYMMKVLSVGRLTV